MIIFAIVYASYLLGHSKYLVKYLVRNKPLLASNFDAIAYLVCPFISLRDTSHRTTKMQK